MQGKLIQTSECSIIYGTFRGKENQELFRCPRELDDVDLRNYVNKERCFLGIENDNTEDLRNVEGSEFIGYFRMYYTGSSWAGKWLDTKDGITDLDVVGIQDITNWIREQFPQGCDFFMKDYLQDKYPTWGSDNRFLMRPIMSEHFKIMIDTTYGNHDYPVRIYCYKDKE